MNPGALLRLVDGRVQLAVKVVPRAAHTELAGVEGTELKIRVAAPPVDSAANEALVRFLADALGCPRGSVRLVRGATSRHKVVAIDGLSSDRVRESLGLGSGAAP